MKLQIIFIVSLSTLGLLYFNSYLEGRNQNTNSAKFYESTVKSIFIGGKVGNTGNSFSGNITNNPILKLNKNVRHNSYNCTIGGCTLIKGGRCYVECQGSGSYCNKFIFKEFFLQFKQNILQKSDDRELYSVNILTENYLTEENYFDFTSKSL